uniref:Transposase n=1 Tax=Ascaris lumbricoides TaxID=6252 RepID=A0A0M3HYC5_ASCLU
MQFKKDVHDVLQKRQPNVMRAVVDVEAWIMEVPDYAQKLLLERTLLDNTLMCKKLLTEHQPLWGMDFDLRSKEDMKGKNRRQDRSTRRLLSSMENRNHGNPIRLDMIFACCVNDGKHLISHENFP